MVATEETDDDADATSSQSPRPEDKAPSRRGRVTTAVKLWLAKKRSKVVVAGGALILLAVVLVPTLKSVYDGREGPRVNLGYTTYVGNSLDNNVSEFLGMRYASAPTGPLRWRTPIEPRNDSTIHSATKLKPICLAMSGATFPYPQDEDCLYANVWAPSTATNTSRLPVWVYIQGGGYTSNANANYNGAEVVERSGHNIVFVNFNYRVGLWGFLASKRVRLDGDLNVGLLDQRELLRWVRRHIAQFGGDPNHVVIAGGSAGAGSVALHTVAYGGRNDSLFVGAIAESVFLPAQPFVNELEWQFDRVLSATGCSSATDADVMSCLRALDTSTLEDANVGTPFPGGPDLYPLFYWTPCIDGDFLRDLPYRLFRNGSFLRVPMLYGTTTDEGSVFSPDTKTAAEMEAFFAANFQFLGRADIKRIVERYPPMPLEAQRGAWFPSTSLAYGETTFTCPAVNIFGALATRWGPVASPVSSFNNTPLNAPSTTSPLPSTELLNRQESPSNGTDLGHDEDLASSPPLWLYRYNVQDDDNIQDGLGVPHLFESAAVFGPDSIHDPPQSYYTYNAPVVPIVMDYWISFVRALDPNVYRNVKSPIWRPWGAVGAGVVNETAESEMIASNASAPAPLAGVRLVFETGNYTMERISAKQLERCQFWLGLSETMRQ